jgi:hypothetical protein
MAEYNPKLPPVSLQEVIAASGKQLSTEDYTNEDKAKVADLLTVAEKVAAGKTENILGSGEIGVWDATTQARIAALVALGWPLAHIIISYVAASGEPAAVTAANVSVAPSISAAELTGELPAASVSVSPTIDAAALVGTLAADSVSVTPVITEALLVSEGSVSADSVSVTPVISEAQLIGALLADNVSVTPAMSEAALTGELAADGASVTPQIGAAEAIGVLLADNVSVTPQISAAELTEESASPVVADNVSVTPTISEATLVGVLAAANVAVTPSISAAELTGGAISPQGTDFESGNMNGWIGAPEELPAGWSSSTDATGVAVNSNADTGTWSYEIVSGAGLDEAENNAVLAWQLSKSGVVCNGSNLTVRATSPAGIEGKLLMVVDGVSSTERTMSTAYSTHSFAVAAGTHDITLLVYSVAAGQIMRLDNLDVPQ